MFSKYAPADRSWLSYTVIFSYLVFALFPLYLMAVTSIKPDAELYDRAVSPFFTHQATAAHFQFLLGKTDIFRWFWNSLFVTTLSTSVSVVVSALAAYALARLRFRGAGLLGIIIFLTYLVPPTLLFIPLVHVVSALGLANTLWALVLTYPTFQIPFCTWMLAGYFKTIPREIEECAFVDGASRLRVLLQIVLPVALPGLITATLFSFTLSWGELMYAISFISSTPTKTLPMGILTSLIRQDVYFWGPLMGGTLLASVPIVLAYSLLTEYFVSGLTAGATKG